ncbi:MAG: sugar-binding protein [Crocinitomicaceae bacterium]
MLNWNHKILLLFIFIKCFLLGQVIDKDLTNESKSNFRFKKINLYEGEEFSKPNVRGFQHLDVFDGSIIDFWTSEGADCINYDFNENKTLTVRWNKDQSGCDWVGIGFGWSNWIGKDINYVYDTLALELTVKSIDNRPISNIPWAFCFEDYSDEQVWLGYDKSFLQPVSDEKGWSKVIVPLNEFPITKSEVDLSNVKQLMIEMFAEGTIEIKSIRLIPFSGHKNKEFNAYSSSTIDIDGNLIDWKMPFEKIGSNNFSVSYDEEYLYFAFQIFKNTTRQNGQVKSNLWNGDAVEIAFSSNPFADPDRSKLLLSDFHFGINCGINPYVWDFVQNAYADEVNFQIHDFDKGYNLEFKVPLKLVKRNDSTLPKSILFEAALNLGNGSERIEQVRWNSNEKEGFYKNPSLWGKLNFK